MNQVLIQYTCAFSKASPIEKHAVFRVASLAMKAAQRDFLEAMLKLYKEGESTDAYLVCQGVKKPVHSAVLVARCLIVVFVWVP